MGDDDFERALAGRLPLAAAVLELFDFAFDDRVVGGIYDVHRGRCYTDVLTFPAFLTLVRDALLGHGGSAHRLFAELERDGLEPVDESNFYRKLARTPVEVSRALLRECALRLRDVCPPPPADLLPGCVDGFEVLAVDGKKVRGVARRLKATRSHAGGRLLGAKALVALDLRSGLAIAMSDALDGEANDLPLVKDLLPQLRRVVPRPVLFLADRQFGNVHTLGQLAGRDGDHFVVRVKAGLKFAAAAGGWRRVLRDEHGREVIDELVTFGCGARGQRPMTLRRITLRRDDGAGEGDDDVVLVTDLTDAKAYPAEDLLKLYRRRWGIEQVFQQVTETFALDHLIGCAPKAVLLQFALCLLMYDLVRVLKGYVADDGRVDVSAVSTHGLFYDARRELQAWAYLGGGSPWTRAGRDAVAMRRRLLELLAGSWDPVAYTKASDRKPREPKPPPSRRPPGGHTSVQRLLDAAVKGTRTS